MIRILMVISMLIRVASRLPRRHDARFAGDDFARGQGGATPAVAAIVAHQPRERAAC